MGFRTKRFRSFLVHPARSLTHLAIIFFFIYGGFHLLLFSRGKIRNRLDLVFLVGDSVGQ